MSFLSQLTTSRSYRRREPSPNNWKQSGPAIGTDFSATFTIIAFDDSSLRWLEINT
jgi:hypothetical protein